MPLKGLIVGRQWKISSVLLIRAVKRHECRAPDAHPLCRTPTLFGNRKANPAATSIPIPKAVKGIATL